MTHAEGRGGNQPWLHDSYGVQLNEFWGPWAEIHPDTAREHGVGEGELIWLESTTGRIAVKARLFEGAMPGMVNLPYEYGHVGGGRWADGCGRWADGCGRWADGCGANPNEIAGAMHDRLCGVVSRSAVRVRIYGVDT